MLSGYVKMSVLWTTFVTEQHPFENTEGANEEELKFHIPVSSH